MAPSSKLIPERLSTEDTVGLMELLLEVAKEAHSQFEAQHLSGTNPLWLQFYAAVMAAKLLDRGYVVVNTQELRYTGPFTFTAPIRDEDEADLDARNEFASVLNRRGAEL